jgi:AICAR transformylase/IMP cyclohydrolase PurH
MSPARKLFFATAAVIVLLAPSPRAQETFAQTAYLKASNTDAFDQFGSSVAISADTIVVGAPNGGPGGAA